MKSNPINSFPSLTNSFSVKSARTAKDSDLIWIKPLLDKHRNELGFITYGALKQAIQMEEIICVDGIGILHFHNRKDCISTLYHLCVLSENRLQGYGRLLIEQWESFARQRGINRLRLKCPIDLRANGFYHHLGFYRAAIEPGKKRALVVWEKRISSDFKSENRSSKLKYIASLSAGKREIEQLKRDWWQSQDQNENLLPSPFQSVIYSPLSCPPSTTDYFMQQKLDALKFPESCQYTQEVWLDSGAYQVQQGKYTYQSLLEFLNTFYRNNQWADAYVLPDIVPLSTDSSEVVQQKVQDTIFYCQRFFDQMPNYVQERAVAPVQGWTVSQVNQCIEAYARLGIKIIGFGSWGTSGKNGSVNMLSKQQLAIFDVVLQLAKEYEMQVHCFGIGGTSSLKRLKKENLIPDSLDSTSWWKAGGFGNIFFHETPQIQITVLRSYQTTKRGFEELKQKTGHSCLFCENIKDLRTSRKHRIMHNLSVWLETLDRYRNE